MMIYYLIAALMSVLISAAAANARDQIPTGGLTSPAIDPNVFREGEVRRRNQLFGAWSLDCDEIPGLGQRLCSLRTLAVDAQGAGAARMTISTDERGRPAAVFDLPHGVDLNRPIEISPTGGLILSGPSTALLPTTRRLADQATNRGAGRQAAQVRTDILKAKLRMDVCDTAGCHVIWSLSPADIAALRAGANIQITYELRNRHVETPNSSIGSSNLVRRGIINTDGLADAIKASLK
jgi:invasion protein IalB